MYKTLLITIFFFSAPIAAGGDEMKNFNPEGLIERCIDALSNAGSVHVENGVLTSEWSNAHVNTVSIGNHATITFYRVEEADSGGGQYIFDDPKIYCLINDQSEVAHLMSPEKSDGAFRMTDLVALDDAYEKKAFDKIVDAVRRGVNVYAYDTRFSVSGRTIKKVSDTKVQKLDPLDYKND